MAGNQVHIDLEKAYDRVPREELWYCMRKSGVAEKYVRVVQDMYERSRTVVRCAVGQTEEFNVEVGLHQGSALSPFLFAIVMDQLSEEVRQESPWTMMFADDIVICSESREQVEENLERWRFALERRGMKVSRSKTEYMCVNEREGSGTVRLQGEEVKKVQEFKYLGSTVQSNGECGKEVKKRVQAGWNGWRKVSGVLCDQKISARIKGKVYRTVVRPAMLYGLETVSLRKRQESELEVAELKMLRFSLGVTRLDRIRNEYIRGTAHVGRLGDKVREARLRWFGHVQRRDKSFHCRNHSIAQSLLENKLLTAKGTEMHFTKEKDTKEDFPPPVQYIIYVKRILLYQHVNSFSFVHFQYTAKSVKQRKGMQLSLLVLWALGTSLVWADATTEEARPMEDSIACSKSCSCLIDDYTSELIIYCSARNLTQTPADIPTSARTLWLDGNLFTSLSADMFKNLSSLDFLNLQSGHLSSLDSQVFRGLHTLAHLHLERNNLRSLPSTIFQNTPSLASLSLHNNQLSRIDERLFAGLSHMWLLNLGWNSLSVLPETGFHDLHGLRELVLAGNRLAYLQPQLFQGLAELKELDLSGNYLRVIKANVFLKLVKLQKLYLAQNQIVTVAPRAFMGLKSLRWLDLSRNRLSMIHDETFLGLHSLHVLRLSNNSISSLKPGTFRDLQYLEELCLYHNQIRALGERVFEGLIHLEVLNLEDNRLQEARAGTFVGLSHLAVIKLTGSCFRNLPDQVFKGLSKLHSIHLDKGCLTKISTQGFAGLTGLRRLFLQHNNISVVERQSFLELQGLQQLDLRYNKLASLSSHTFYGLKNLDYLLLSNNFLRHVPPEVLLPLQHLSWLDLSGNKLEVLLNATLHMLPLLRYLNLKDNLLTTFPPSMPDGLDQLWLSGNKWKCDCSAKAFKDFSLQKPYVIPRQVETLAEGEEPHTLITIYNNITCASPPTLAGLDLRDVSSEQFC
ncbi:hypothetical protein QTP86_009496 [Hemibagrus guttatus]|nr:hypothetical protein QTP86_009496 [Hemibagrus guttatus]